MKMSCKRSENIRIENYGLDYQLCQLPDVVNVLLWYCLPIPDEVDQLGNVHTHLWAVHGGKQVVLSCPGGGLWSVVNKENNKKHLQLTSTKILSPPPHTVNCLKHNQICFH